MIYFRTFVKHNDLIRATGQVLMIVWIERWRLSGQIEVSKKIKRNYNSYGVDSLYILIIFSTGLFKRQA